MKAIIIDDVATARETLQEDVATYCPDIEIIGTADGVVSGAKLLYLMIVIILIRMHQLGKASMLGL